MIKKIIEKFYGKFCQCNDEITRKKMIKKCKNICCRIWDKIKSLIFGIKD